MPWSITIGRVAGTAVRIHLTFILFLAWVGVSGFLQGGSKAAIDSLVFMVLLFLCVLLHEFGHILVARRYGVKTPEVTLLPIGGVASLERIPEKPSQELAVAIAGPAVNVVIALILLAATGFAMRDGLRALDDPNVSMATRLIAANLFIFGFNLLPAFPMDGGRVLHAILAMRMEPRAAMRIASRIGQALAFVLGFLGLFGNPLLVFIAIFVYMAAAGEAQDTEMRSLLAGLTVADAMETRFATLPVTGTLAQAVETLLATPQHEFPVVDAFRKPVGMLVRDDLIAALRDRTPDEPLADILRAPFPTLRAGMDLASAMTDLGQRDTPAISVVDPEGALVGLLTRENIAEMMLIHTARPEWQFTRRRERMEKPAGIG